MLFFGSLSYLSFLYHLSINLLPYQTLSFLISFVVQRLLVWCNPFLGVCGFFVVCLFAFVVFEILYKNMCGPTNMMKSVCYHLIASQIWFLCLNFRSFLHRVRARGLVSLLGLQTDTQFSQHQSLKKPPFAAHKVHHLYTHKKSAISIRVGFICIPSIQFHWPMSLCLCQCCTVLISIALQNILKSVCLMIPASFFLLNSALVNRCLLCFQINFRMFFPHYYEKHHWDFNTDCLDW